MNTLKETARDLLQLGRAFRVGYRGTDTQPGPVALFLALAIFGAYVRTA